MILRREIRMPSSKVRRKRRSSVASIASPLPASLGAIALLCGCGGQLGSPISDARGHQGSNSGSPRHRVVAEEEQHGNSGESRSVTHIDYDEICPEEDGHVDEDGNWYDSCASEDPCPGDEEGICLEPYVDLTRAEIELAMTWILTEAHPPGNNRCSGLGDRYIVADFALPGALAHRQVGSRDELRRLAAERRELLRYVKVIDDRPAYTTLGSLVGRYLTCSWGREPDDAGGGLCGFLVHRGADGGINVTGLRCGMGSGVE